MKTTIYQVHTVRRADGKAFLPDYPFDYIAVPEGENPMDHAHGFFGQLYPGYTLRLTETDLTYREYEARSERLYYDKLRELLA